MQWRDAGVCTVAMMVKNHTTCLSLATLICTLEGQYIKLLPYGVALLNIIMMHVVL